MITNNWINNWYKNDRFSLLPKLKLKKADKENTSSFIFNWLFIKIWSLDSFQFEIAFVISEHWGIGFTMILPYIRIVCCIPLPYNWDKNLYRRPPKQLSQKEIRKKKLKKISKI